MTEATQQTAAERLERAIAASPYARSIGPRRPGTWCWSGSRGAAYRVLDVEPTRADWMGWSVTVEDNDGEEREHCTPWDTSHPWADHVLHADQPGLGVPVERWTAAFAWFAGEQDALAGRPPMAVASYSGSYRDGYKAAGR